MQDGISTPEDTALARPLPSAADRLRQAREALQEPALPRHRRSLLPLEIACLQEREAIEAGGFIEAGAALPGPPPARG